MGIRRRHEILESKPNFVDQGFIGHFFEMIKHLQLQMGEDLMLTHPTRPPISLLEIKSTALKDAYRSYARYAMIDHLAFRIERAKARQNHRGNRDDMADISAEIDIVATRVLKDRVQMHSKYKELLVKSTKKGKQQPRRRRFWIVF